MTAFDVTEHFGRRALRYDQAYDAVDADGSALRSRMTAIISLLGPGPGAVLDAGMGPGRLLTELDRRGWTVYGLDLSAEMVGIAQRNLPAAGERLSVGSIESLPFPDDTFDALVATGVLEYADPVKALRELARVLRPSGCCVVSYPNPRAWYAIWNTKFYYPTVRAVRRAVGRSTSTLPVATPLGVCKIEMLLRNAGFSPTGATYTSFLVLLSPLDELLPRAAAAASEWTEAHGFAPSRLATQVVFRASRR